MSLSGSALSSQVCASARRRNRLLTCVGHLLKLPLAPKAAEPLSPCATLLPAKMAAPAAEDTIKSSPYSAPLAGNMVAAKPLHVARLLKKAGMFSLLPPLQQVLSKLFARPVILALAVLLSTLLNHTADASSLCGNNIIEEPEQCDDGNQINGDACSASCQIEVGHLSCGLEAPIDCGQVCGDGILASTESCDDGNVENGDGCSSTCSIEQPVTFACPIAFDQRQKELFPGYKSPRENGELAEDNGLQPLKNNFEPLLDAIPYCNGLPAETASRKFLLEYKVLVVIDQSWIDFYAAHQTEFSTQGYQTLLVSPQILFDRVNYLYERQFGIRFSTRTVIANGLIEDCREGSPNVENQSIPATLTAPALKALGVEKHPDEATIYRLGVGGKNHYCASYASFYPFGTDFVATNQQPPFVNGYLNHRAAVVLAHELGHSFGMLSNSGHPHFDTGHLIDQVPDIMVYNGLPIEAIREEGMFFNFLTSCTPTYAQNVCAAVKGTARALTTRLVCDGEYGNCSVDTDADGEPDAVDTDDDGDEVADKDDFFPLDPAASADNDHDGSPDQWNDGLNENMSTSRPRLTLDDDDDNDGLPDSTETEQGTDPLIIDTDGDFADVWSNIEQARNWRGVALSGDGTQRYGAVRSGAVYRTTSPNSWEAVTGPPSGRAWDALATSSDGSVVVATEYTATAADPPPQVWLSEDSGATWSGLPKTGVLSVNWMSDVALSDDGNVIALANDGFGTNGDLFVSTDRGVSWSVFDSNKRWSAIAMSSDGVRMAAVDRAGGTTGQDFGRVWTSADSGATWVEQLASPALSNWSDIAMSADGRTLVTVAGNGVAGNIYVSTDFGVTWSENPSVGAARWASVTASADGRRMVAGVQNGAIYLSTDTGTTWNPINSVGAANWTSVSLSDNGLTLLAARANGQLVVWEGAGDAEDDLPTNAAASVDTDGDGAPNAWNAGCEPACQDSSNLKIDDFPSASAASIDTDGDGQPDNWNAGCDSTCQLASGLTLDSDDDNDLVDDSLDACPSTPSQEAVDALGCSETQKDDDNDDINNADDSCPTTPGTESGQINTEGCGPSERDTDGDGVNDDLDAFPNDPNETLDSDGDGYGDNEEISEGTDPNDADDQPIQSGLPIWLLHEATKQPN